MIINFSAHSPSQRYHLMTQTIIPRPIAWVLTQSNVVGDKDEASSINLAPFSYFTAVSSEPAILMLSIGKKPNGDFKDTIVNTLKNKKLVIHIASTQQAALVTATAATLEHGESELNAIRQTTNPALNTVPFEGFSLPRLEECDIAYGCEFYESKELGDSPQTLLFVEVKQLYLNPKVIEVQEHNRIKIHADAVAPLARLGANEYAGITKPFKVERPS